MLTVSQLCPVNTSDIFSDVFLSWLSITPLLSKLPSRKPVPPAMHPCRVQALLVVPQAAEVDLLPPAPTWVGFFASAAKSRQRALGQACHEGWVSKLCLSPLMLWFGVGIGVTQRVSFQRSHPPASSSLIHKQLSRLYSTTYQLGNVHIAWVLLRRP